MTLIIDGYNLLRKLPDRSGPRDELESGRAALEAKLRRYLSDHRGVQIILVYDGGLVGQPTRQATAGLEVLFSRPPRQADDLVLDLARRLEGSTEVTVVTSDMADIGNRLAGLRVRLCSSEVFARRLTPSRTRTAAGQGDDIGDEKPAALAADEARTWVEEFGFGSFDTSGSPHKQQPRRATRKKDDQGSRP
jgi:predicted RNA-binding protein with PIN domain